ncbi:hypothetical protein [Thiolapillus sp.]|uniref:hypothetical protein n=1 Tax=Thiolapillus sp. TaxID=2017437 RepID=UPI003AF44D90
MPQPSWSPSTTQQLRKLVAAPYLAPNDWTPRSEAYFVFPLAQGTPGKQCGLAATGVYQPSLRSPWLAAKASIVEFEEEAFRGVFLHFRRCLVGVMQNALGKKPVRFLFDIQRDRSGTQMLWQGNLPGIQYFLCQFILNLWG